MIKLFFEGGPLFMGILTLLLLVIILIAGRMGSRLLSGNIDDLELFRHRLSYLKTLGALTMSTGLLGTFIGLYSAFIGIEAMDGVSQAMLAGGLKVASITGLYGIIIYVFSIITWLWLDSRLK